MILFFPVPEIFTFFLFVISIIVLIIGLFKLGSKSKRNQGYFLLFFAILGLFWCNRFRKQINGTLHDSEYYFTMDMLTPYQVFAQSIDSITLHLEDIYQDILIDSLASFGKLNPYSRINSKCYYLPNFKTQILNHVNSTKINGLGKTVKSIQLCSDSTYVFNLKRYNSPKDDNLLYHSYYTTHEAFYHPKGVFRFGKKYNFNNYAVDTIIDDNWNYRIRKELDIR